MDRRFIIALLWALILAAGTARAEELYTPLDPWDGELLPKGYGAFYIKIRPQGFTKNSRGLFITSNVFIHLNEVRQGKKYVVSQTLGTNATGQQQIWKIPAGDYIIQKLSLTDNSGLLRSWISPGKPRISVRHLFLSNLGELALAPGKGNGLLPAFRPALDSFVNRFDYDAFAGVMDGYTQTIQKKLGGQDLFGQSKDHFSTSNEARAVFSSRREISMHYKVDMGKGQRYSRRVLKTLAAQDLDLRTCYMDQLDREGALRGRISFRFRISSRDGVMQDIRHQGGTLISRKVRECLYLTLGRMQFPIAKNLDGRVTFYFNFNDEMGRSVP